MPPHARPTLSYCSVQESGEDISSNRGCATLVNEVVWVPQACPHNVFADSGVLNKKKTGPLMPEGYQQQNDHFVTP